jgi:hypothetical protein
MLHGGAMSRIQYPIEVSGIDWPDRPAVVTGFSAKVGDYVAVRSCKEEHGDQTYLGIFLGDGPQGLYVNHDPETKRLKITYGHNPMMYVPELKEIIWGCGSWWHKIDKPEDLKQITDQRIENVWYVKALKELDKQTKD